MSLGTSLEGTMVLSAERHSQVYVSPIHVGEGHVHCQGDGVVCGSIGAVCKLKGVQGVTKDGAGVGFD